MPKPFSDVLVLEPPGKRLEACVTVPAKDEEELLPSALRALAEQKTLGGDPLDHDRYEVILLINNTRDRSRQAAEQFQRLYPSFRLHIVDRAFSESKSHNGYIRRLLMDEACRRLEMGESLHQAILTTDADSQVAPNWISRNQEELANGAQAVAGRIVISPCDEALLDPATGAVQRYNHLYRRLVAWVEDRFDPQDHDPWPRHHQHFAASLAITPRVYKCAGRLPPRRYFEDICFYQALIGHDVRLRHSNRVRVFTSARLTGRARVGLSTELNDWRLCGKKALRVRVECREFLEYLFAARRRLRRLWLEYQHTRELCTHRVRELSAETGISVSHMLAEVPAARYFGLLLQRTEFYEMCRNHWPDRLRVGPMEQVVNDLTAVFREQTHLAARAHRGGTVRLEAVPTTATRNGSENARARHRLEADTPERVQANGPIKDGRTRQYGL
jgi:glycosyltransferase involved in cell wall biosynthesis